jgi:ABC-type branched-subunit amino acid transport system substrate-binding protein
MFLAKTGVLGLKKEENMKKWYRMSFLCVLVGMLFVFPMNAMAEKPINIGVLVPLSGIVAQGGEEMKMGIQMAAEEKKTILGRPINLIVEDTRVKPPIAVSKAEKLVFKDDCKALIGVFSSGVGWHWPKISTNSMFPFCPPM